ncbi:MAG TPA: glycosyltransferase [Woeseiaceae bacterium]|nr:glycosyltransferase [Woeseiaceae bacterium]
MNVPRLDLPGGVTNFYRVLQGHLGVKQCFELGWKSDESGLFARVRRLVTDYWRFHRTLANGTFSLVHLNPSFRPKSLLRDAGFLLIARAHAVPALVFFHGWDESFQATVQRRFCWLFRSVYGKAGGFVVLAEEFRQHLQAMGITSPVYRDATCIDDSCFVEERYLLP